MFHNRIRHEVNKRKNLQPTAFVSRGVSFVRGNQVKNLSDPVTVREELNPVIAIATRREVQNRCCIRGT